MAEEVIVRRSSFRIFFRFFFSVDDPESPFGEGFHLVLAGDDALTLPILSLGGMGVISVAANVVPRSMANLVDFYLEGNVIEAQKLYFKLFPLFRGLFVEVNPVPVKHALGKAGIMSSEVRLPLCELRPENAARLEEILEEVEPETDLFPA